MLVLESTSHLFERPAGCVWVPAPPVRLSPSAQRAAVGAMQKGDLCWIHGAVAAACASPTIPHLEMDGHYTYLGCQGADVLLAAECGSRMSLPSDLVHPTSLNDPVSCLRSSYPDVLLVAQMTHDSGGAERIQVTLFASEHMRDVAPGWTLVPEGMPRIGVSVWEMAAAPWREALCKRAFDADAQAAVPAAPRATM